MYWFWICLSLYIKKNHCIILLLLVLSRKANISEVTLTWLEHFLLKLWAALEQVSAVCSIWSSSFLTHLICQRWSVPPVQLCPPLSSHHISFCFPVLCVCVCRMLVAERGRVEITLLNLLCCLQLESPLRVSMATHSLGNPPPSSRWCSGLSLPSVCVALASLWTSLLSLFVSKRRSEANKWLCHA